GSDGPGDAATRPGSSDWVAGTAAGDGAPGDAGRSGGAVATAPVGDEAGPAALGCTTVWGRAVVGSPRPPSWVRRAGGAGPRAVGTLGSPGDPRLSTGPAESAAPGAAARPETAPAVLACPVAQLSSSRGSAGRGADGRGRPGG